MSSVSYLRKRDKHLAKRLMDERTQSIAMIRFRSFIDTAGKVILSVFILYVLALLVGSYFTGIAL